ncbi:Hypothetical predicted protein, partial [Pelobates cultripes]
NGALAGCRAIGGLTLVLTGDFAGGCRLNSQNCLQTSSRFLPSHWVSGVLRI